ncbi:MAG: hypothetical protein HYV26_06165 [Candidatus Hydrogenedentes bacterium]|nr:hypothetical protein [Candidatus Hydrogenedentota bacterium]MBI3118779.1 hypothetical protein [Candidatus Hydrogenedentota bacterium]
MVGLRGVSCVPGIVFSLALGVLPAPANAAFHTWGINEVYSNADGSVQFIELREGSSFDDQEFLTGHTFETNANTFTYPSDLPSSTTADKFFLMATAGFGSLAGGVTADYTIPANFFSINGDTLNFADVDLLTFGSGVLPTDGVNSMNASLASQVNSPTNFAGQSGSIQPGAPDSVWVDFAYVGTESGTEAQPFNTLTEAVEAVASGGTINLAAGTTSETGTFSKEVRLVATSGPVRIGVLSKTIVFPNGPAEATSRQRERAQRRGPSVAPNARGALLQELTFPPKTGVTSIKLEPEMLELVYPAELSAGGAQLAHASSVLSLRLRADTPLDPDSIWTLLAPSSIQADATWECAAGDDLRDVWVHVSPRSAWPVGGRIFVTVGATTVAGVEAAPVAYEFAIEE